MKWFALEVEDVGLDSSQINYFLAKRYKDYFVPWVGVSGKELFNVLPGYIFVYYPYRPSGYLGLNYGSIIECPEEMVRDLRKRFEESSKVLMMIGVFKVIFPCIFRGLKAICVSETQNRCAMTIFLYGLRRVVIGPKCFFERIAEE